MIDVCRLLYYVKAQHAGQREREREERENKEKGAITNSVPLQVSPLLPTSNPPVLQSDPTWY